MKLYPLIEAGNLKAGDLLHLKGGDYTTVISIETLPHYEKVYNFDIEGNENYYVTEDGILVHNGYQRGRLPKTNVEWVEGTPGNGLWKSDKPEVNAITNNEPIPFTNGRPDFSKWKVGDDLKVDGMTGADSDFPKIYEKMKQEYGFKTQKEAKEWLSQQGLTPHHLDDKTVQLIPTDLHGNVPHKGSASDMRELNGILKKIMSNIFNKIEDLGGVKYLKDQNSESLQDEGLSFVKKTMGNIPDSEIVEFISKFGNSRFTKDVFAKNSNKSEFLKSGEIEIGTIFGWGQSSKSIESIIVNIIRQIK